MLRFLSALSFHYSASISIATVVGADRLGEFDPRASGSRVRIDGSYQEVPSEIQVTSPDPELALCLGLMREGNASGSSALSFLSYWKVIEIAIGDRAAREAWLGDEDFARLNEMRVAAAHAIPDREGALLYDPDDPTLAERLSEDKWSVFQLATKAIEQRWPSAVMAVGKQFTG